MLIWEGAGPSIGNLKHPDIYESLKVAESSPKHTNRFFNFVINVSLTITYGNSSSCKKNSAEACFDLIQPETQKS